MPSVKYLQNECPNIIPHVWCPDFFVDLAKNLVPGAIIKPFSKGDKEYNEQMTGVQMDMKQHTPIGTHLTDYAFHAFVDKQVEIQHKNYCKLNLKPISINKFNLPEKYVVLTTGHTVKVREMLPKVANELITYIKGKGYEVVTLGSYTAKTGKGGDLKGHFNEEINYTECYDLINKTNLLEAGKIISQAKAIIGVDNGLLHLAGCTDVPIIGGYTTVEPRLRMPYRNDELGWNCYTVEPDKDLPCRFCQSTMVHMYDHDFRECYYKDLKCVSQLTSNKYIEHLEKILV